MAKNPAFVMAHRAQMASCLDDEKETRDLIMDARRLSLTSTRDRAFQKVPPNAEPWFKKKPTLYSIDDGKSIPSFRVEINTDGVGSVMSTEMEDTYEYLMGRGSSHVSALASLNNYTHLSSKRKKKRPPSTRYIYNHSLQHDIVERFDLVTFRDEETVRATIGQKSDDVDHDGDEIGEDVSQKRAVAAGIAAAAKAGLDLSGSSGGSSATPQPVSPPADVSPRRMGVASSAPQPVSPSKFESTHWKLSYNSRSNPEAETSNAVFTSDRSHQSRSSAASTSRSLLTNTPPPTFGVVCNPGLTWIGTKIRSSPSFSSLKSSVLSTIYEKVGSQGRNEPSPNDSSADDVSVPWYKVAKVRTPASGTSTMSSIKLAESPFTADDSRWTTLSSLKNRVLTKLATPSEATSNADSTREVKVNGDGDSGVYSENDDNATLFASPRANGACVPIFQGIFQGIEDAERAILGEDEFTVRSSEAGTDFFSEAGSTTFSQGTSQIFGQQVAEYCSIRTTPSGTGRFFVA